MTCQRSIRSILSAILPDRTMGYTILALFRSGVAAAGAVDPVGNPRVVHKSTAGGFGLAQAVVAMGDDAERDGAEADRPAGGGFCEADRLAGERAIEVDEGAPPFDLAVGAYAPHLVVERIVRLAQDAAPAPERDLIMVRRGGVAERLVRALVVVEPLKRAEAVELLAQGL